MKVNRVALLFLLIAVAGRGAIPSEPTQATQGTSTKAADESGTTTHTTKIEKMEAKHLPNPVRVHSNVISGGLPEGDAAFAELKNLGIKTVISVDSAKPDVATAAKFGLRYVHLPHSYDGVSDLRAKELAKAVRDLPGPIYIHCHHGKHRSPAASAIACIGAGLINHEQARQVLAMAGTGENYVGLFQSVNAAQALDRDSLDSLKVDFPATAKVLPMAEAMVKIEHVHDHLKIIEKAGWKSPANHPALSAGHESLLLREHFTELLRSDEVKRQPEKFQQLAREAESLCQNLEEVVNVSPLDTVNSSKAFAAVTDNCKSCHQAFRDVPAKSTK